MNTQFLTRRHTPRKVHAKNVGRFSPCFQPRILVSQNTPKVLPKKPTALPPVLEQMFVNLNHARSSSKKVGMEHSPCFAHKMLVSQNHAKSSSKTMGSISPRFEIFEPKILASQTTRKFFKQMAAFPLVFKTFFVKTKHPRSSLKEWTAFPLHCNAKIH